MKFQPFRKSWWQWVAIGALCVVLVILGFHMTGREPVADADLLIEKFRITTFSVDFGARKYRLASKVKKWNGEIRITLIDPEPWQNLFVSQLAVELSKLTKLKVIYLPESGEIKRANVTVRFMDRGDIKEYLVSRNKPEAIAEQISKLICSGTASNRLSEIFKADIIVPDGLESSTAKRCFIEEITQSLGLYADSELVVPSIFSNLQLGLDYLPLNDKILIRTLYDPRIKPGMSREATMEIARELIPKLVQDVRWRGVEALYQR
ncbi:MAG: hypothetical protein CMM10_05465 [Rhodospirillaceae bacterium]|jgi:hypothetical protein|nr:hypothetical protein [Rhodospirillaceae bacterium]|tara:strand:+ start:1638 stop:2429 length:792 start_codon:yes stop_codon:yes gene_type:complete